ncbi:MAG: LPS export ABC transporter periplasmic protein LptC [Bacteroidia bacterium]|nr:LPS export ABC transporter periplasmic protein LptC [Bacteroidia bacterium]
MRFYLLCSILFFLAACSSEDSLDGKVPFQDSIEGVKSEAFGVEYFFSDSARVTARLSAGHMIEKEEGEDPKKYVIQYLSDGVEINFLNSDGRTTSKINSKSGIYNKEKGLAELTGSVVLLNGKGEKLETEQLFWKEMQDSIYTPKFVRIETPERIIIGEHGMRANSEFTAWTILESRGELTIDDE